MSFDPLPPAAVGVAGLTEWCRRDRDTPRLRLAAAAGDPVALATLESQLRWPIGVDQPGAGVEILAARRAHQLTNLASQWPDVRDLPADTLLHAIWEKALRHLVQHELVNVRAVAEGPLAIEAMFLLEELRPSLAPVTWDSFCFQATSRRCNWSRLRATSCYGFVDTILDIEPIERLPRSVLRALRGSWQKAPALPALIAATDLRAIDDPIDVAVFWEAAVATGQAEQLTDRFGDYLTSLLIADDDPGRWWPAVLALLTDWVVP